MKYIYNDIEIDAFVNAQSQGNRVSFTTHVEGCSDPVCVEYSLQHYGRVGCQEIDPMMGGDEFIITEPIPEHWELHVSHCDICPTTPEIDLSIGRSACFTNKEISFLLETLLKDICNCLRAFERGEIE